MNSNKPIIILGAVLLIAVGLSIFLSSVEKAPSPIENEPGHEPSPQAEATNPEPTVEIDLSASKRMSIKEGRDLYRDLAEKIGSATSAVIRVRFDFPQKIKGQDIQGEIRYDFAGATRCRVESTALQPKVRGKIEGEWEFQKIHGISVSSTGFREVNYRDHKVFDVSFSSTMEEMVKYTEAFKRQATNAINNPLQDLLAVVPHDDRLREVIRANLIKSSEGNRIEVVSRMTRPMVEAFEKSQLKRMFPYLAPEFGNIVALRTDWFDPNTGLIQETVYSSFEKTTLVTQTYSEISLGVKIPESRFALELPTPAVFSNINSVMENKLKRGLRYDDWVKAQGSNGGLIEATTGEFEIKEPVSP